MVSGTTPRRIRSMSSCENTRSSVTDALRPGRAQVFHVLGTAVRSCGLISCLSIPRRPCSILRRAEPLRCHRRLAGAVRHTGRTRGCTTSAVAMSSADPEPRRPGSIRTCPPSTPALRARSASSFFGGEPSPGRPTNIVNTRLRCPGGVRRDAPAVASCRPRITHVRHGAHRRAFAVAHSACLSRPPERMWTDAACPRPPPQGGTFCP